MDAWNFEKPPALDCEWYLGDKRKKRISIGFDCKCVKILIQAIKRIFLLCKNFRGSGEKWDNLFLKPFYQYHLFGNCKIAKKICARLNFWFQFAEILIFKFISFWEFLKFIAFLSFFSLFKLKIDCFSVWTEDFSFGTRQSSRNRKICWKLDGIDWKFSGN